MQIYIHYFDKLGSIKNFKNSIKYNTVIQSISFLTVINNKDMFRKFGKSNSSKKFFSFAIPCFINLFQLTSSSSLLSSEPLSDPEPSLILSPVAPSSDSSLLLSSLCFLHFFFCSSFLRSSSSSSGFVNLRERPL